MEKKKAKKWGRGNDESALIICSDKPLAPLLALVLIMPLSCAVEAELDRHA